MATYKDKDKEFATKYKKEIEGISKYNNVDLSVAKEMFKTNLDQERGIYGGGGVAENFSEMVSDYRKLKEVATSSSKNRTTTNSKGQTVSTDSWEVIEEKKTESPAPAPAEEI